MLKRNPWIDVRLPLNLHKKKSRYVNISKNKQTKTDILYFSLLKKIQTGFEQIIIIRIMLMGLREGERERRE